MKFQVGHILDLRSCLVEEAGCVVYADVIANIFSFQNAREDKSVPGDVMGEMQDWISEVVTGWCFSGDFFWPPKSLKITGVLLVSMLGILIFSKLWGSFFPNLRRVSVQNMQFCNLIET